MKAIVKSISIFFALLFLLTAIPISADAEPDDLFTVDGMRFKVLTESGTKGTVQVGDGSDKAIDSKTTGALKIPATVLWNGRTYTVTSIGDSAYNICPGLTSVAIPNSVTSIGDTAFNNCRDLSEVWFVGDAPTVGSNTFYNVKFLLILISLT